MLCRLNGREWGEGVKFICIAGCALRNRAAAAPLACEWRRATGEPSGEPGGELLGRFSSGCIASLPPHTFFPLDRGNIPDLGSLDANVHYLEYCGYWLNLRTKKQLILNK